MGLMSSVALFHHFFYLQASSGQYSGCVYFVAANGSSASCQAGKKVEDFRNKWIFMDAKRSYPQLEMPTGLPTPQEGWSHEKLTNPWAEQLLEKMVADL